MLTTAYPLRAIGPGTIEIDEFDCGSIFLLEGRDQAMVIDTGSGIGDLRGLLARLTDKPLLLVLTHAHGDHTGGIGWFDEYYLHPADWDLYGDMDGVDRHRQYAGFIAKREGKTYPYDPMVDIRPWPEGANPKRLPLADGQSFDLGGRVVTAYHCPGHTPGSMVFHDSLTNILFAGDACNCNMLMAGKPGAPTFTSVERGLAALKRVAALDFCCIYNGHHDFRPLGQPLDATVLPNLIGCCEDLMSGNYHAETIPGMFPGMPDRTVVRRGTVMVTFTEEGIRG